MNQTFGNGRSRWPPSLLFIILNCLSMTTRLEHGAFGRRDRVFENVVTFRQHWTPNADESNHTDDFHSEEFYDDGGVEGEIDLETLVDDREKGCIMLESYLQLADITMDDVRQRFGEELLRLYSVKNVNMSAVRTTFVSPVETCFALNGLPALDMSDSATFSLMEFDCNKYQYPYPVHLPLNCSNPRSPTAALDLAGRERNLLIKQCWQETEAAVEVERRKRQSKVERRSDLHKVLTATGGQTLNVGVEWNVIQLLPTRKRAQICSCDRSIFDCVSRCKTTAIERALKCTPTSLIPLRKSAANYPECVIEKLASWRHQGYNVSSHNWRQNEEFNCIDHCLNSCEDWMMSFKTDKKEGNSSEIIVSIVFDSYEYLTFEETPAVTFEEFLGDLGGILGLYLGIDMISAAQLMLAATTGAYAAYRGIVSIEQHHQNQKDVLAKFVEVKDEIERLKGEILELRNNSVANSPASPAGLKGEWRFIEEAPG